MPNRSFVIALLVSGIASMATASAGPQAVSLTLDWTPNPDHIGFYYAQATGLFAKAGLKVTIRAPSDPTAPLKLVALGRSDLAVSYEQELFYAVGRKLPVVAVAAVVPQPLNSIIAIKPAIRSLRNLKGRTVGITGVPSDYADLDTALAHVGLTRKDVKVITVGYNLLPALLSGKVDAVLGVYRNVEGIELQQRGLKPTIIPLEQAGIPFYDELVLVANPHRLQSDPSYKAAVARFVQAFLSGTAQARQHPARSLTILKQATASDPRFLTRAIPATLALLSGPNGIGCLNSKQWQAFGNWMHQTDLLTTAIPASRVISNEFLPPRCTRSG